MRLFSCEINCQLPLLAHSGPSVQLTRLLRARSGLFSNILLKESNMYRVVNRLTKTSRDLPTPA
ncbi:hypothetical protein C6542_06800 [Escherichia coli]|nr:hypothetical protein C5099_10560 [Escherichia coli]AVV75240.1 hypothetical protein C5098_11100 [Escherichia coli]EAA3118705.1 hypothetical protein [Escherichia coli]EAC0112328.1 hypothetical protein [Escherichia coli]EFA4843302.1 hypothetical protein [Escherichia coli]